MTAINPGHLYYLAHHENKNASERIQFIEKIQDEDAEPGKLVTVNDGTTNEEVLKMLGDRLQYLFNKVPDRHTSEALNHVNMAALILDERARLRKRAGVEGMQLPIPIPTPANV